MEFYKMINCFCSYIIKPAGETTKKVLLSVIRNLILIEIHLSQIRISDSKREKVYAVCPYILFFFVFPYHIFIPPFLHTHLIHFVSFHPRLWRCVKAHPHYAHQQCRSAMWNRWGPVPYYRGALTIGIVWICLQAWPIGMCGWNLRCGRQAETFNKVALLIPSLDQAVCRTGVYIYLEIF